MPAGHGVCHQLRRIPWRLAPAFASYAGRRPHPLRGGRHGSSRSTGAGAGTRRKPRCCAARATSCTPISTARASASTCRSRPQGSPYRRRVWQALRAIPPGETRTYQEIARVAGGSARSVGGANGANPIPILIPCHRVVAAAGIGGLFRRRRVPTKRYLLDLETPHAGEPDRLPAD